MKRWQITGMLLLCLVLIGATACNPLGGGNKEETGTQLVKVIRGDLTVSATGDGNVETSREARLSFNTGGRVDKIYVAEGDKVNKGKVLAKLETNDLELALAQAQVTLIEKQVALTQAQVAQQTAEHDLKNTTDTEDALNLALFQAQIDTRTAEYNLEKAQDLYTWSDIKIAEADVDEAKRYVEDVLLKLSQYEPGTSGYEQWQDILVHAQSRLDTAKDRLDAMTSNRDTEEVAIKKLQVEAAQKAEAQAQKDLDDLVDDVAMQELRVDSAKQSAELARKSVELAQKSLDQAQKDIDEATLIAPFDGVVATVGAEEGDIIPPTTVSPQTIVYLIDPGSMELIVEMDEIDIPMVKLGQEAIITIDALPDTEFHGEVTSIYPLPTEKGGVVLYNVKIRFEVPENHNVKAGMSASADIITNKRSDVLLVPSRAIQQDSQGNPIVQVMINEQIEERPVTIGISDDLTTEIVSGLNEGETVVVETRAKQTTSELGFF